MQDQNVMAAAKWKIIILQQLFSLFIDQDHFHKFPDIYFTMLF